MTDRLFADCCYGTEDQHGPGAPCPQEIAQAIKARERQDAERLDPKDESAITK